jgi:hypothetical protein
VVISETTDNSKSQLPTRGFSSDSFNQNKEITNILPIASSATTTFKLTDENKNLSNPFYKSESVTSKVPSTDKVSFGSSNILSASPFIFGQPSVEISPLVTTSPLHGIEGNYSGGNSPSSAMDMGYQSGDGGGSSTYVDHYPPSTNPSVNPISGIAFNAPGKGFDTSFQAGNFLNSHINPFNNNSASTGALNQLIPLGKSALPQTNYGINPLMQGFTSNAIGGINATSGFNIGSTESNKQSNATGARRKVKVRRP